MMTFTQLRGLGGKTALPGPDPIAAMFTMSPPVSTTPPSGFTPGNIATQPTVTVVQTPTNPGPVAYPPTQPPPDAPSPPYGDGAVPGYPAPGTVTLGPAPMKKWVPWAIGGGIVAAVGTAIIVALANR